MSGCFFDFASQIQKNNHSFKMFFGGVSRQRSFETASKGIFRCTGHRPAHISRREQLAKGLLRQPHYFISPPQAAN
jgi:hypothetical protein